MKTLLLWLLAAATLGMSPASAQHLFPLQAIYPADAGRIAINPNNPTSPTTLVDSYGATWSFQTTGLSACDAYNKSPDCWGDWPLMRNGVVNNPNQSALLPPSQPGAYQAITVPGDPHLYAYYNGTQFDQALGNMWYQWDGTSWTVYGSAPPMGTMSTTSIPTLFGIPPWGLGGANGYNTTNYQARIGRVPDVINGGGNGPFSPYINNSAFYDASYPGMPQEQGYTMNMCSPNGTPMGCGSGTLWDAAGVTGTAGNTYFTTTTAPAFSNTAGWLLQYAPAGIPAGTVVQSITGSASPYTVNLMNGVTKAPVALTANFSGTTVRIAIVADWDGVNAGTYDAATISQIQNTMKPMASVTYFLRISGEWCCSWEIDSPWGFGSEQAPNVSPKAWAMAHARYINLLRTYLVNCGVANGCNPNIKIVMDGPEEPTQASYFTYSDPTFMPQSLAQLVDFWTIDDYRGSQSPNWTQMNAWSNYRGGISYWATMAQQYNKSIGCTECADTSYAYSTAAPVDGTIQTQFANLVASYQGPGAIGYTFFNDISSDQEGPNGNLTDYPGKINALNQAWPNGFKNTSYGGSYWTLIPVPSTNPFNGTGPQPSAISLSASSATVAASGSTFDRILSIATLSKSNGGAYREGITSSDNNLFQVGTVAPNQCQNADGLGPGGLCIYTARPYTSADVGTHTTSICSAETPTLCATFTLTVD